MSGLKTPEGIFLDLLYLAETGSNFYKQTIPESIFIDYLKLSGSYKELKQKVDQSLEGITRERFLNEYPPECWPQIEHKIEVFSRKLEQFDYEDDGFSNYHHFENEYIKNAYQYYCDKTGHIHGKPISPKTISDRDSIKMVNMMESIGKAILLKETLQDVQDHLEFHDLYSSDDLQIFDGVADACWKFYEENNSITKREILFKIENNCFFKKYSKNSVEEAKSKAVEAAKQWFRDVKKNNGIIIPK